MRRACTSFSGPLCACKNETNLPDSIKDLNDHCLDEFRAHWKCLDNQNHQLWNCRPEERRLNSCVFDKLVCVIALLFNLYKSNCCRNWRK